MLACSFAILVLAASVNPTGKSDEARPPLIPREILFGNAEGTSPRISPDGARVAWLESDDEGVFRIHLQDGAGGERRLEAAAVRSPRDLTWSGDSRWILFLRDREGDENDHLHAIDVESGALRDLTPFRGVKVELVATSPAVPDRVLVALNRRDPSVLDVHSVNLTTGEVTLDTTNPGDVVAFTADELLRVRGATAATKDGGWQVRVRATAGAPWHALRTSGPGDEVALLAVSDARGAAIVRSTIGAEAGRILEIDLATDAETVVAAEPDLDADDVLLHPVRRSVQAVSFAPARTIWKAVDPAVEEDLRELSALAPGDLFLADRDRDDRTWIVGFRSDRLPVRYYRWDRPTRRGRLLFSERPRLERFQLAEMRPIAFRARDGLLIRGYVTLPPGKVTRRLPAVVLVHGGPWDRVRWGFDAWAQWLANRGYAVVQPNYRGSTGYGKAFLHAADKQWGRAMQRDLSDTVRWAVAEGIADGSRVAIMGGSYGGYATLVAAAFTPALFRCGIDIVGPSDLRTLLESFPPYWARVRTVMEQRVGNPADPREAAALRAVSPLFRADRIRMPLLVAQGGNDPRVPRGESDRMVDAIARRGGAVVYVVYPDEGHGLARPENRLDFFARAELFLARQLGGRAEPLPGGRVPGSSAIVEVETTARAKRR